MSERDATQLVFDASGACIGVKSLLEGEIKLGSHIWFGAGTDGLCVAFHDDGRIEFGEKYRDNPDAAAQEFMRIVREQWPNRSVS